MNYYYNNIRHVKGDTFSCGMIIEELGQDLESVYFTCRDGQNDDSEILFTAELYDGITLVDYDQETDTRKYAIRIAPSKTVNLQLGTYFYDLQIGINGDIFTIMRGNFIVEQDATKTTIAPVDPELYIKVALDSINGEVIGTTVTNKTDCLAQTKAQIKTALNDLKSNITDTDTFRSYVDKINSLGTKIGNIYNATTAPMVKLNAPVNTAGSIDIFGTATNQTHTYFTCEPNTKYVVIKENNVNTLISVYETVDEPAVNVSYTSLYTSSNTPRCLVKTSSTAQYLDIRMNTNYTNAEDLNIIKNSIRVYNITQIASLTEGGN